MARAVTSAWQILAHALAGAPPDPDTTLGEVRLLPHQREAVAQLRRTLARRRIALLADETGLGKTFVACALAAEAQHTLVVAPAAISSVWRDAAQQTGVSPLITSYETLSRGRLPDLVPDFVILDEAHHARSPNTTRWRALAMLCRSARVLLISATPIHNRPADLAAQLALVLGHDADGDAGIDVLRTAVRRRRRDVAFETSTWRTPDVAPWRWHPAPETPGVATRLDALPPAIAPVDGTEAAPLWRIGLVRAWASSDAALLSALRRRIARGLALQQALRDGHPLTRADLLRWTQDDVVTPRLVLVADGDASARRQPRQADLDAISAHVDALQALVAHIRATSIDQQRSATILATLEASPSARAVCFTTYSATAEWYWTQMRHLPGVALVTGRGGRIASGPLARHEIFAALGRDGPDTRHAREQIRLLITTDVASEGLTLTAASVVWHADLPWTPAKLAQRTGRLVRLGSPHATVTVHAFAPPWGADAALALPSRLADKARHTALVGRDDPRMSGIGAEDDMAPTAAVIALRRLAAARASARGPTTKPPSLRTSASRPAARIPVAVHYAATAGVMVVLGTHSIWTFGACDARSAPPDTSPSAAWRLLAGASADEIAPSDWSPDMRRAVRRARDRVRRAGLVASATTAALGRSGERSPFGIVARRSASAAHALLRRAADALRNTAPTHRPGVAALVAALRRRLAQPIAAGWHQAIAQLATAPDDTDWWSQVDTLLRQLDATPPAAPRPTVRAIFVLVPPPDRR